MRYAFNFEIVISYLVLTVVDLQMVCLLLILSNLLISKLDGWILLFLPVCRHHLAYNVWASLSKKYRKYYFLVVTKYDNINFKIVSITKVVYNVVPEQTYSAHTLLNCNLGYLEMDLFTMEIG